MSFFREKHPPFIKVFPPQTAMVLENPSLFQSMENALIGRQRAGIPVRDISQPMPTSLPDFFSNDYLSLATDPRLRRAFLERLDKAEYIMGTTGTRALCGSPSQLIALEERLKLHWDAPAAVVCNSGYDANLAFFRSVPQSTDTVIYDELVHASVIDGLKVSRASHALVPFSHNSLTSLRERILRVLDSNAKILKGEGTLFLSLESAYSMDGDFAPLLDIVAMVEELVPAGSFHIVVDEAHTTGLYGLNGRGFVSMLGLDSRVHTVLHTFGKGCGFFGAVLLTHPLIKMYLANYARPLIYSNSLPHCNMEALHAILDYLSDPIGDQLRTQLQSNAAYFKSALIRALGNVANQTLLVYSQQTHLGIPKGITSPIFPLLTSEAIPLARYLQTLGYEAQPIPYPVVPKGQERIRIIVHAGNLEKDMDDIIEHIVKHQQVVVKRKSEHSFQHLFGSLFNA
ncbi:hypothetical protein GALMADRAFT_844204 [Galerina marginata CBS 339.88]|uniref:Aminotransferase class I/classII large domain-containing protein n=1 Tax=Galerina marginata (strain CBS 339.88) TaxID=685588 RepID=A0A067TK57_GALM3|nr:hypothetical protein GALMADRAFT_844204 [Galerina marginata CBS 339.88]